MKIIIRTDASTWIGSGHVMRCLVLADELKKRDYSISFVCLPQQGDMISYIETRGFSVLKLKELSQKIIPTHDADYEGWLQRSVIDDAEDFIDCVQSADLIITDHYAIDHVWQRIIIDKLGCYLVAIDDLVRTHDADLIIDQTLGRISNEYKGRAQILAGSDYALLAPKFFTLRERGLKKTLMKGKKRVLISMGGVDKPNSTLLALKALVGKVDADFTVLLNKQAPNYQEVKEWCLEHTNVTHCDFESDMANLMLQHDLAIGAPGTTSWERACLGLPSILIPLATNQLAVCDQLIKHDAIVKVSLDRINYDLLIAYKKIISQWDFFHINNLKLCDGVGATRVVMEISRLFESNKIRHLQLIKATEDDISLVYQWQSHPKTREYALNKSIPTWDEHKRWMVNKINDPKDYFYIVLDKTENKKLGVLRLDYLSEHNYVISIYMAPVEYGKGIASLVLKMIDDLHKNVTIHATVLENNVKSQKLFKKSGYIQIDNETYIRYAI